MGKPAARVGDLHTCLLTEGANAHVGGTVGPSGATVLIGGQPAATVGTICQCSGSPAPNSISMGSATVFINGKAAARQNDLMAHAGGTITSGLLTVLIGG
jgi:uncharacterized Zn-binding protein involved in type VI secretion